MPRTAKSKTIEVQNVGPVRHVSIPIPEDGGVVVLRGQNGAGKSETIAAVDKMLGRNSDIASPTDGLDRGEVSGLGVKMTVGRSTRKTGQLEVVALDSKLSVADIVDPGIANNEAADEKRMKAILSVLQVKPNLADWMPLAGDDEKLQELVQAEYDRDADVLLLSSRLKLAIGKDAIATERERDTQQAVLDRYKEDPRVAAKESPKVPASNDSLAEQLTKATDQLAKLEQQKQKADQVAVFKAELDSLKVGDVDKLRAEYDAALKELENIEAALESAKSLEDHAARALNAAVRERDRVNELQSKIDAAAAPAESDIEAARNAVSSARAAFTEADEVRAVIGKRSEASKCEIMVNVLSGKADRLRDAAAKPEAILAKLVQSKVPGIRFDSGRLIYKHPKRGDVPFRELSTGERWKICMAIAIEGVGPGGLLTIPQDAWQDLDPANREYVDELAREGRVVILTAECSADEELNAEVFGQ